MPQKGYKQTDKHKYKIKQTKILFICPQCKSIKYVTFFNAQTRKYCSQKCHYAAGISEATKKKMSKAKIGKKSKMFGKHQSAKMIEKISGANNVTWKDNVGYMGLHLWVIRHLGQPTKCEHCRKDRLTGHQIDWANKDHMYKRNLDDWLRLCRKCHCVYDKIYNNKNSIMLNLC